MAQLEAPEGAVSLSTSRDDGPTTSPPRSPPTSAGPAASETAVVPANEPVKKTKLIRRKRRPARPQVDPATIKSEPPPQTGTIFNIWYNKWSGGDREDKYLSQTHAQGRCNIAGDSGYTRADGVPGSYFCLHFARGLCPRGQECDYLHRLPGIHDHFNPNVDCFGRDKHSDYRDDMGGVGSFTRQNRTLYIGRIHVTDDIEEIVARHFAEWGDVERTRVLTGRGVGFVTYANETNAQFAKEAMAHQSLDNEEILNVRWATMDPNPQAQKREAARIEEQAAEAVRRALPAEFVREIEGRLPDAKKRRREQEGFQLEGYDVPDEIWYAQSKAVKGPDGAQPIEGPGEQQAIEAPASEAPAESAAGIISASALAAVKGFAAQRNGVAGPAKNAPAKAAGGPLVGYGSDDDSD